VYDRPAGDPGRFAEGVGRGARSADAPDVRHRFVTVLAVAVCAVLAPSESMIRRILQTPKSQETAGQESAAIPLLVRALAHRDQTRGLDMVAV